MRGHWAQLVMASCSSVVLVGSWEPLGELERTEIHECLFCKGAHVPGKYKMVSNLKASLLFQVMSLGMHRVKHFCQVGKCGITERCRWTGGKQCRIYLV